MVKKVLLFLVKVALLPLMLVLVLIAMPVALVWLLWQWFALRRYCWRNDQWQFLICSARHDWHEFLQNNVLPALPAGVAPVWYEQIAGKGYRAPVPQAVLSGGVGLTKPYLAKVRFLGIQTRSLHAQLLTLKDHAKRDRQVQDRVRAILEAEAVG